MSDFHKSYDSLARAADAIFNRKEEEDEVIESAEEVEEVEEVEETIEESAEVTISLDLANILTERLRAGSGKTTVDVDYIGDSYFTNVSQRKFKLKIKPTSRSTADITGEKKDIIAFLQTDDYGMEDEDIKDLFPELLR